MRIHCIFVAIFFPANDQSTAYVIEELPSFPCARGTYPPAKGHKVNWFDVDLDESPERRWLPIIRAFEPRLAEIRDASMAFFADKVIQSNLLKSRDVGNGPRANPLHSGPLVTPGLTSMTLTNSTIQ